MDAYVDEVLSLFRPRLEQFVHTAASLDVTLPPADEIARTLLHRFQPDDLDDVSPTVGGSRTLATDTGVAVRGWLIFAAASSRLPVVLALGDYAYTDELTRQAAQNDLNQAGLSLLEQVRGMASDQILALLQQEDGRLGAALVDRIIRFWDRPRLEGIDWLRTGAHAERVVVAKIWQDERLRLPAGTAVMVAGDGFNDVHGTVTEDRESDWLVELHWNA